MPLTECEKCVFLVRTCDVVDGAETKGRCWRHPEASVIFTGRLFCGDGEPKDAPHPQDIRIEESTLAELHEREAYEALARACAEKHELADETDTAGFAKLLAAEEEAYDALDALKPRKAKRT